VPSENRVTLVSLSGVCSAYYTSVESSTSRVPLSQSPAIDERKSSLDAVVEGNLHGLSVTSPFAKALFRNSVTIWLGLVGLG